MISEGEYESSMVCHKNSVDAVTNNRLPCPPIHPPIVYSSLTRQVIDDYGVTQGVCLDIGSGRGFLGIELARKTNLRICLVDIKRKMLEEALRNAEQASVAGQVMSLRADVHRLPFKSESVNLVVSRGSLFFWKDKAGGLREIHRVLSPSGVAFVGGGLGRYLPDEERRRLTEIIRKGFKSPCERRLRSPDQYREWLTEAEIENFRIIIDGPGAWMEIRKRETKGI